MSLKPLMTLKPLIFAHKSVLWGAIIALAVSALAMLSVPLAVRRMIDKGFMGNGSVLINNYFLTLIGIGLIIAIASPARYYFVNWIGERVVADLRAKVFVQLSKLGPAYFDVNHSGEIMSRLTADTTQIKAVAGPSLSQAARNTIMLFGALIMMFVTSAKLSALVFLAIPIIVLPLVGLGRLVRRLSREAQDTLGDASAYAAENLAAYRTMQAFVNEKPVSDRYSRAVERAFAAAHRRIRARAALTGIAIFLTVASVTAVLWYAASAVISGDMTGGRLGQFVLYALFAAGALAEVSEVWGEINQVAGAAERLSEMMATVPEICSPKNPTMLPQPAIGSVTFENILFSYAAGRNEKVLDGISFRAEPGETLALVGPSGAGKSTIFNLLLRFYDPDAGIVRVDGVDIREADLSALRNRIALVPQDITLFADTVAENIRYGTPGATLSEVRCAAMAAQVDDFIRRLPEGYNTRLCERGTSLSGGQRQRIAIARAILKNAPILLLDEATSSLDAESEGAVRQAIEGLMKDRTTIVIAHRLATVQRADRILVIENGRIVEAGTHDELVCRGGIYAHLAELQFGREAAAE